MITGFAERDVQSCEVVTSMGKNISGDKYNEEERSDAFLIEVVTA